MALDVVAARPVALDGVAGVAVVLDVKKSCETGIERKLRNWASLLKDDGGGDRQERGRRGVGGGGGDDAVGGALQMPLSVLYRSDVYDSKSAMYSFCSFSA